MLKYVSYAQDTVYADAYPKGIVCEEYNLKEGIRAINNPKYRIDIPKKEVIKVTSTTSVIYEKYEYKPSGKTVVPTDPFTGNILYTEIIEVKNASKKNLYEALKTLPKSNINYELISSDETEYSTIYYRGSFFFKFAGDLQTVYFGLKISIKEGKLKYEYTDFRYFFAEQKGSSANGGRNYSIDPTHVKDKPLELLYSDRYRGDKFWGEIAENINSSIKKLHSICDDLSKNDW